MVKPIQLRPDSAVKAKLVSVNFSDHSRKAAFDAFDLVE